MPRQKAQEVRVPSIVGQGGGGSSPVAALITQQAEQQLQVTKLLKTLEKMQIENQKAVQAAAQAGGGAATQVANQVAAGMERSRQEGTRERERAEDKQFAVEQQELNAKLQQDAAKEAASMGQAVMGQREKWKLFRESFLDKRDIFDRRIAEFSAMTDRMHVKGYFASPEGRKRFEKRVNLTAWAKIHRDDQLDDRHVEEMHRLHNRDIQALIQGDDPMDLSSLSVEPLMLPLAEPPHKGGRRVAESGEVSPEKMFELKLFGMYPMNGVLFPDEPNSGVPEGYHPRTINAGVFFDLIARDDEMKMVTDESLRQELTRKHQDILVKARDRLIPLKDEYDGFNRLYNSMAPAAVERALENFLALDNSHKFDDMGRTLTAGVIKEMFNGGRQGEEIAVLAMEIFDGKREPKSDAELHLVMMLESALFNAKTHMMTEFMGTDEAGGGMAIQLAKQIEEEFGSEAAALSLGVSPDAVGFVGIAEVMQGRLSEVYSFTNRMHEGIEKVSILEQFLDELGKVPRLADLYAVGALEDGEGDKQRILKLMAPGEALEQVSGGIDTASPEEILAEGQMDFSGIKAQFSLMDRAAAISDSFGPDALREAATWITAELEPDTTPNIQAYLDQSRVDRESSGYARAASNRAGFNQGRRRRSKKRSKDQPTTGQSFKEKGAVGVVTEQLPALLSLGAEGAGGFMERIGPGIAQAIAGKRAAAPVVESFRQGQGALARFGARHFTDPGESFNISNLTPEEKEQVITESERRR